MALSNGLDDTNLPLQFLLVAFKRGEGCGDEGLVRVYDLNVSSRDFLFFNHNPTGVYPFFERESGFHHDK